MRELRQVIRSAINFEIGEMTRQAGVYRRCVCVMVLVGSTTRRDIIFGLDLPTVGVKPGKALSDLKPAALRLAARRCFPSVTGRGGANYLSIVNVAVIKLVAEFPSGRVVIMGYAAWMGRRRVAVTNGAGPAEALAWRVKHS